MIRAGDSNLHDQLKKFNYVQWNLYLKIGPLLFPLSCFHNVHLNCVVGPNFASNDRKVRRTPNPISSNLFNDSNTKPLSEVIFLFILEIILEM